VHQWHQSGQDQPNCQQEQSEILRYFHDCRSLGSPLILRMYYLRLAFARFVVGAFCFSARRN
jgi:hypothetical protein